MLYLHVVLHYMYIYIIFTSCTFSALKLFGLMRVMYLTGDKSESTLLIAYNFSVPRD